MPDMPNKKMLMKLLVLSVVNLKLLTKQIQNKILLTLQHLMLPMILKMLLTLQLLTQQAQKKLLPQPLFLCHLSMLLKLLLMKLQLQNSMQVNKQPINLLLMPMGITVMIKQLSMLPIKLKIILNLKLLMLQVQNKLLPRDHSQLWLHTKISRTQLKMRKLSTQ
jgi:hypothetical protein